MTDRGRKAKELFLEGYNCSQAVLIAFNDITGLNNEEAARIASSFGGGLARQREVCGGVSGMSIAAGIILGYSNPKDRQAKIDHYRLIQKLCTDFKAQTGSIICHDMLGLDKNEKISAIPDLRTAEYYEKRPCSDIVALAADVLEKHLNSIK